MDCIFGLMVLMYAGQNVYLPMSEFPISGDILFVLALMKAGITVAAGLVMMLSVLLFRKGLIKASIMLVGIVAIVNLFLLAIAPTAGHLVVLIVCGVYILFASFVVRNFDKIRGSSRMMAEAKN